MYLICQIYRAEYDPDRYLWEKEFTLAGRTYQRQDLEASMDIVFLRFNYYCPLLEVNL